MAPGSKAPATFAEWERGWLGELGATDGRLALRLPVPPAREVIERAAGQAVVRGDEDVGIIGGAIDLFSFKTREVRLAALRLALAKAPEDGSAASRADKVLLARLLDSEDQRLNDERTKPELASDLVRGMVATWVSPATEADLNARDALVVRGLLHVTADIMMGQEQSLRINELEDAMDPLERLTVTGYPRAAKAFADARIALGQSHRPMMHGSKGPSLELGLAAHLGQVGGVSAVLPELAAEEVFLRREASAALGKLGSDAKTGALETAASLVEADTPADIPKDATPARSLRPPPERALLNEPLKLVATAATPLDEAIALVTLHDDTAIALWALSLEHGPKDLDLARAGHPLIASVPSDKKDRLARAALVSPVRAIAPGLMAYLLDKADGVDRAARAVRWRHFGDAPLDIVAAQLDDGKE
jgi:hypothetical protein